MARRKDRPMAKQVKRGRPAREPAPVAATGPQRYTVERFLSDCSEPTREYLMNNWREGEQLVVDEIPADALPPVVMLACYGLTKGIEIVDDYVALLDRYWEEIATFAHPDKFFSSCIVILDEGGFSPDPESYETIKIPAIFDELLGWLLES